MAVVLEVDQLRVSFATPKGELEAVRGASFTLREAETLGIVGESGAGKSVTALALLRLLPTPQAMYPSGSIRYAGGDNLLTLTDKEMQKIRGREMAMIFQDASMALNPTMRIGAQVAEGIVQNCGATRKQAMKQAVGWLERVGISDPERGARQYPFEFSGGMRQRIMVAMAFACQPKVLIADEPTASLDAVHGSQILDLFKQVQRESGTSIIFISHDLHRMRGIAHRVAVMYSGSVVESGTVEQLFREPQHPYTAALLRSALHNGQPKGTPLHTINGSPPAPFCLSPGCSFAPRCEQAMRVCQQHVPPIVQLSDSHASACWLSHGDCPHPGLRMEVR